MEGIKSNRNERGPLERVTKLCDSEEEAAALVEEFWDAMPHGRDLTPRGDYSQELTMGDRTMVRRGIMLNEKGKWVAFFLGNNQPLTPEAEAWLRNKGLVD